MGLKSVIVLVDHTVAAAARIAHAARLADRHDAHLTGLYTMPVSTVPAYIQAQMPEEALRVQAEAARERSGQARSLFEGEVAKAGLRDRSEWRQASGEPARVAALMGRYSDLLVAGQERSDDHDPAMPNVDELVLSCGRPVLVVPYAHKVQTVAEAPLIAWNGSREAARAVADALPLLRAAKKVTVLAVNPDADLGDEPGADIALHLARHGVDAEASRTVARDLDPADALLNHAADRGSDLIVMGAYGHARLRELVLGGVTRSILGEMTVPVLMSH